MRPHWPLLPALILTYSLVGQTVGPNLNVSKAAGNQYESAVAINPANNNQIFIASRNETGGLSTARSSDGGVTWTTRLIGLGNLPAPGDIPRAYGNASVAWDSFGNLFLTYLSQGAINTATYVAIAVSKDGGATFYAPYGTGPALTLPALNPPLSGDQPTVVVGAGSGGYAGSVYITFWSRGGIWVSSAGVSGLGQVATFTSQVLPSQPPQVNFGDIAVGPNGEVMVTYGPNTGSTGNIYVNVDPDGLGPAPFGTYIIATPVNMGGFTRLPAQPNWGVDPEAGLAWDTSNGPHRGRVYLVYTDAPVAGSNDTNIFVIYSDNLGASWSTPVRVNDDVTANSQFLPRISLDATNGSIAVTWYDARNSVNNDTAQYYGAFSIDGGATFGANFQISTGTSNQANSVAALRKADFGDYTGNAFSNGRLIPAWADNSNSTGDNPDGATNFDVYTAVITAPFVPPPPAVCSATNATVTSVNKWWLDVVLKAGDPLTHVVYTPTASGTTFVGVTGFAVGELVDYTGTLDASGVMCNASKMTVKPAPAPLAISPVALPAATIGVSYSVPVTVTGGLAPAAISSVTALPTGLSWTGSAITGTPTALGTTIVVINATDARGLTLTVNLPLTVNDALITFAPSLPSGTTGAAYSATLSATGGYGAFSYAATGLPAGLALTGATISGTPTTGGTFAVTLTAKDATGTSVSATVALVITSYTVADEGSGKVTAFGDHYVMVGVKEIIWDANTRYRLNAAQIKAGMPVQWKGKRDPNTGIVLASQLEIN